LPNWITPSLTAPMCDRRPIIWPDHPDLHRLLVVVAALGRVRDHLRADLVREARHVQLADAAAVHLVPLVVPLRVAVTARVRLLVLPRRLMTAVTTIDGVMPLAIQVAMITAVRRHLLRRHRHARIATVALRPRRLAMSHRQLRVVIDHRCLALDRHRAVIANKAFATCAGVEGVVHYISLGFTRMHQKLKA